MWWEARRAGLTAPDPRLSPHTDLRAQADRRGAVLNCNDDAFFTAAAVLKARAKDYPNRDAFIGWVVAQDVVFSNCAGMRAIPPPLKEGTALMQADRAYQIAAAHFYAADFDEAPAGFKAIAADATSPWQGLAGYLEARSMVRKGLIGKQAGRDVAALEQALKVLKAKVAAAPNDARRARRLSYARFEDFKGTGNSEIVLDRRMMEKRILPAVDINCSGTRREELLLGRDELMRVWVLRKVLSTLHQTDAMELMLDRMSKPRRTPSSWTKSPLHSHPRPKSAPSLLDLSSPSVQPLRFDVRKPGA